MRITSDQSDVASRVNSVTSATAPAYNRRQEETPEDPGFESSAAMVSFSPQAQEIARAKEAVNATPDVREDLVNSLRDQVQAGTYNPRSEDIADMMMRRQAADSIR